MSTSESKVTLRVSFQEPGDANLNVVDIFEDGNTRICRTDDPDATNRTEKPAWLDCAALEFVVQLINEVTRFNS